MTQSRYGPGPNLKGTPERKVRGPWSLLHDRTFILLTARGTSASIGYSVYLGTILWLSYRLTGGVFLAGVLIGIETAVYTLTLLAGPVIDRVQDKRWVYVVCYPIQAAASLVLGLTFALGYLTVPILVAIVVLLAALWDLTWAADSTATRLLFGKENLFAVSGLGTALGGAVDVALFFTAGLVLALFGATGGAYFYAGLLLAGTVLAFPLPILTARVQRHRYLQGFLEGWRHYRGEAGKGLRHLAILQFSYGFFVSAPLLLLPLYVGRYFDDSQGLYATLYVVYLVGGMAIGLVLGWLNPRDSLGTLGISAVAATGVGMLAAEVSQNILPLQLFAWTFVGVAVTTRSEVFWSYTQGRFAPDVLARISGNSYLFAGIAGALGAVLVGSLSQVWGLPLLTDFVAAGFLASAGIGLALPGVRALAF